MKNDFFKTSYVIRNVFLLFLFCLVVASCTDNDIEHLDAESELIQKNQSVEFENLIFESQEFGNSLNHRNPDFNSITQEDLEGTLSASIDLIKSYGITESEIISVFGSLDHPSIIVAGMGILRIESAANDGIELVDSNGISLLTGEIYDPSKMLNIATQKSEVFDCAMQALGITALGELISNGVNGMSKGAARKFMKRVFVRYMGWIGAGIAVYEFGDCMNWW
ncbi:MAG: hypothetical protein CMO82_13215 [Winogradskyella sp.]|nr:hypothetical protein [Winogradskyella sp.]|tara:strand:+ start:1319 stop:1987 length:669 start_codon:yes stop_codon:yes gene_type:complete